ncbi:MAG: biotin/lipoyl-containing protein [Gemmataceae bacterium]
MPSDHTDSPHPFDVATIERLIALMSEHDLNEIDLYENDNRIRLRRGLQRVVHGHAVAAPVPTPVAPAPIPVAHTSGPVAPTTAKAADAIKSPTPGTFYAATNPDTPPFVSVGSRVTPTTVVCIIEAMKIFNEIHADMIRRHHENPCRERPPVEYDQPLFEIDS